MEIKSYKNRNFDKGYPVQIYRCLNRKGNTYSVRQFGKVIGHTNNLELYFVHFRISKTGKIRCNQENKRNVHAYAEGYLSEGNSLLELNDIIPKYKLKYNPYSTEGFTVDGEEINYSKKLLINDKGIFTLKN